MGTDKRERHKSGHQRRIEAARTAQRRADRQRRTIAVVVGVVVAVLVVGLVWWLVSRSDEPSVATEGSTTTTAAPVASAAGKPCVPLADPLPEGAPQVPVTAGPPPTELTIEDIVVGEGEEVPAGAPETEVSVQYIGVSCSTGKIFDSSWQRGGQPATFPLGGVIAGWQEGIPGMKVGGQRLLVIPPDVAYGAAGSPPRIAPDETLYFVVDLEAVGAPEATTTTAAP